MPARPGNEPRPSPITGGPDSIPKLCLAAARAVQSPAMSRHGTDHHRLIRILAYGHIPPHGKQIVRGTQNVLSS